MITTRKLTALYKDAHNVMRNVDGLQPQEALDELLKYLYFKQNFELEASTINKKISISKVREYFTKYLGKANSWSAKIWREKKIFMSDECLETINDLLFPIKFTAIDYDVRSHAIKGFLTPEIRKGLGIFLTPDPVVKAIVDYVPINSKTKIIDPACGSGTFLIEYLNKVKNESIIQVHGFEKNPRMLLIADLNLGHFSKVQFNKALCDSLRDNDENDIYDLVLTNPPFGVSLDARDYKFNKYLTCQDRDGCDLEKQTSEIVFLERCLKLLKPGGTLSIVIPKSIATNNNLQISREALSKYGYIYSIMALPPETFASTGTQTTTIVLFVKKYKNKTERNESVSVGVATIDNVGFDSTGRSREGNQLPLFSDYITDAIKKGKNYEFVELLDFERKEQTFKNLSDFFINQVHSEGDLLLDEVCEFIGTGRTPPRKSYSEKGNFIMKVGNLTGAGIKWEARDRNFISEEETDKRLKVKKVLILKKNDIVLTASAHNPIYIAKKSDVFTGIPNFLKSEYISFVGEIMMIRVRQDSIDPFLLLAYLRAPETIKTIRKMVRGQTAHLHANDLKKLRIPRKVFSEGSVYNKAAKIIQEQSFLSEKMNELAAKQISLLK